MEEITQTKEQVPHNKSINLRKEKIKNWLKDKSNLTFIGILILAIIVRLYLFSLTKTQALWWDEAGYLAYAKNLAGFDISWIISAEHNSLYPYLVAGLFKIGFGEVAIKFLLQLIPSVLSVVIIYFLASEMYEDKRIGLVAAFLMSVFWVHLFNTTRFHVDIPGLFLGLLAVYVFWQGYEKKEKIFRKINPKWAIPLTAILVVLSYSIRRGYFLFGFFILAYVALTKNWKELVKDKYNWAGLILGLILIFIVEKTIFISGIGDLSGTYFHEELPINFLPLKVFESFFKIGSQWNVAFYLFILGLILLAGKISLSFGHIKNNKEVKADIFNILAIIITLAFFILILRTPNGFGEERWYLPLAFSALICVSRAGTFISDLIKPYNKVVAVIILVALIGIGGYYQYNMSNELIKSKVNSYSGIREMSLFLKETSNKEDVIWTLGQPQVEYYSERKTVNAWKWVNASRESEEHFYQTMDKLNEEESVRYLLITFSESGYPVWARKVSYASNGQTPIWEIPFIETKIDYSTGQQQINQEGSYGDLTFKLINIKQEVFLYEIVRN